MDGERVEGRDSDLVSISPLLVPTADQIYREHAPLLRRVAIRRFAVPSADVDTLVHDVFIAYLVKPENVRSDLRGYLIGSICNASRNYWRTKRIEHRVFADDAVEEEAAFEMGDLAEGLAQNQLAAEVLSGLDSRCRDLLRRYYMEDEKTAAIAGDLGVSMANVNGIVHRCRKTARLLYDRLLRRRSCP